MYQFLLDDISLLSIGIFDTWQAVVHLRESELDTSCAPGSLHATCSVRFPHFLVDIHSRTPAADRLRTTRDTNRFLQDSPITSLLADRVPRQVTLNTTRHIAITEFHGSDNQ